MTTTTPRYATALTAVMALIVALLTLQPGVVQAVDTRTPANAALVSTVPVLEWPAVANAAEYEVQVSTSATFSTLKVSERRSTPAYVFTEDVEPGTYHWRYRAFSAAGTQLAVSPAWIFTRAGQPGPVLRAPSDGVHLFYPTDSPTLRWDPIASYGSYTVQWDDNPDFRSPTEATTTATAFTLPTLLPQDDTRTIYWRVRAVASSLDAVKTAWSPQRSFVVEWGPDGPTLLEPADAGLIDQVRYDWESTAGAADYELQVGLDQRFTTLVHPDTGVDYASNTNEPPFIVHATTYVAPSRYPAKSHWWRVRAIDANGSPGPWSATRQFTRRWLDPAARPVIEPVADSVPINDFEVSWDAVPDTTYYELEIALDPFFHAALNKAVCTTPRSYLAPAYQGSYVDAKRETDCPIRVPESALPELHDSDYAGSNGLVTVHGSGAGVDTIVLLDFGAGDDDNGRYKVVSVVEDDPETPIDEGSFTVSLDRPGTGPVSWRLAPGLVLVAGETFYVRVRAVHETLSGDLVYSMWSDQANTSGGTPPGPTVFNIAADRPGATAATEPADPVEPTTGTTATDWPLLRWDPAIGAEAYLVAIAKDREFTNSIVGDLGSNFQYYVTRGTSFVPQTTLAENTAGGSFFWYVLPCERYTSADNNDCTAPDRDAILQSGRWRSFHKLGDQLTDLTVTPSPDQPWVQLSWENTAALTSGGFMRFEVQITEGTWAQAQTLLTETPTITTSDLTLDPTAVYRWRVRAIDGGLLPLAWSQGTEFTMASYPGPSGLSVFDDSSVQPCLAWDPAAHASGYTVEVYRGQDPSYPDSARVVEQATSYPSFCPTGLGGGKFSWRVRSQHSFAGRSDWSPADLATFEVEAETPVLEGPAGTATTQELLFQWAPVPFAASYSVELSTDDFWSVAVTGESVTHRWTPADLPVGTYSWRVNALDGAGNILSTSDQADVVVPDPVTVATVTPAYGPTAGGTRVTVQGTGFLPGTTVTFGGLPGTALTYNSGTSVTVTTPAQPAGAVDVTVTNTDTRSATMPNAFTYLVPPVVTTVTPGSGPAAGGTTVTITGSHFAPSATVRFGGDSATVLSRLADTGITVMTAAHAAGSVDVTVTNPDGQSARAGDGFTFVGSPSIASVSPTGGAPDGGTVVRVQGTGFQSGATVAFDGGAAVVTDRVNTTGISVVAPAHGPGTVDVTVTNPDGQSATARSAFTYRPGPRIAAVTPDSGPSSGYTRVVLSGSNFDPRAAVALGDQPVAIVEHSTSLLTITTPAHPAGAVDVIVTNPDGQRTVAANAFTFTADTQAGTDTSVTPWFVAKPRLTKLGNRIRVRWSRPTSPGTPVDAYRVLTKTSAAGSFQTAKATSRRRVDLRVRPGTTYWVRVMAHSAAGWGEPGPVARRTVR